MARTTKGGHLQRCPVNFNRPWCLFCRHSYRFVTCAVAMLQVNEATETMQTLLTHPSVLRLTGRVVALQEGHAVEKPGKIPVVENARFCYALVVLACLVCAEAACLCVVWLRAASGLSGLSCGGGGWALSSPNDPLFQAIFSCAMLAALVMHVKLVRIYWARVLAIPKEGGFVASVCNLSDPRAKKL